MKIKIKPGRMIELLPEESLLAALVRCQLPVPNVCNGKGTCGKCKVRITSGVSAPTQAELKHLSGQEIDEGIRLACAVKPQEGMEIELESGVTYDRKEAVLRNMMQTELNPGLEKILLRISAPSLADERGDWDRVVDEIAGKRPHASIHADLSLLEKLPQVLRTKNFKATVTLWENEVLDVEAGDTTQSIFGVALDIGTTSVAAALVDLKRGTVLKTVSSENGQTAYGADVISRISYANESPEQRRQLRDRVRETVNALVGKLTEAEGITADSIYTMTVVANTTMNHLFLGLDVSCLAVSPFVSASNSPLSFAAAELGIKINPRGKILLFPNIASFVGGDTVGAVVGAPEVLAEGTHLLIDLGTNCELFLKTSEAMYACSTAAGPAFEGAGITQGMRAKPGAIEGVAITDQGVEIEVIGEQAAVGICGSGLVEAIEQMKLAGIINKQGTIVDPAKNTALNAPLRERIRPGGKDGREFVLAFGGADGVDVVLNQKDIGELQLAKGAVCAGIKTLLSQAGLTLQDLDSVVLAGTFASYLNARSILEIGLVPDISPERIRAVGNSAHVGAVRALLNHEEYKQAGLLAKEIKHIELGGNKTFTSFFMKSMYIERAS